MGSEERPPDERGRETVRQTERQSKRESESSILCPAHVFSEPPPLPDLSCLVSRVTAGRPQTQVLMTCNTFVWTAGEQHTAEVSTGHTKTLS